MSKPRFAYFDHIADVGIRLRADSLEELFSVAAQALVGWMGPEPAGRARSSVPVALEADDTPGLLVRWLQEILYRFEVDHLYFTAAEFEFLGSQRLQGRIEGIAWTEADASRYQEVKAVTYHQLEVLRREEGWAATVILDL